MRVVSTRPYGAGEVARAVGRMTGLASIGAGMVHVAAAADHSEQPLMMAGFEAVAVLQVALGCLLLFRLPGNPVLVAGLAMMVLSIGLWAASRTVGLGFIPGEHAEPIGLRDGITVLFELSACVGIWELLGGARRPLAPAPLATPSVGLLGALAVALAAPAILVGGHSHGTGGAGAVHAGGHAGASDVAHGGGREAHGRAHADGGGHERDGEHAGRGHDPGSSGHVEHGGESTAGHGHALSAGPAEGHTGHATLAVAGHPGHASAPASAHASGSTGSHGGSTGAGHTPAPGGAAPPPGHAAPSPAPPPPEPEPTLTETVADEIDKLVPGRHRGG
jgi:hypothetical protein